MYYKISKNILYQFDIDIFMYRDTSQLNKKNKYVILFLPYSVVGLDFITEDLQ